LSLGWKRITDKYDERFKLKWVECKSRINYGSFREGKNAHPAATTDKLTH